MLGAMTSLTGGGGLSASSSAAATNGDFQGGNTGFYGGAINFAPSAGSTGGISTPMLIVIGLVALYALRKR
ncbi:hypothetical protein [Agarivorans sp. QJM3NY_25]|uniref:hypothetical protein n=1 Tax=Agarivorans sp. QJM3NY_25 TaxID=3421430 RepID=UPI003D7D63D2